MFNTELKHLSPVGKLFVVDPSNHLVLLHTWTFSLIYIIALGVKY